MRLPPLVVAPLNRPAMVLFCSALRQLPSRAPPQVGTSRARSKLAWQAAPACTMPSVAPSSASHRASTAWLTRRRSAWVKPVPRSAGVVASLA